MKYLTQTLINLLFLVLITFVSACQSSNLPLQTMTSSPSFQVKAASQAPPQRAVASLDTPIRGINYYPQNHPWQKFWLDYPKVEINQDLAHIHQLGFNTVRIFVFYDLFGRENIQPQMKDKLVDFLETAQQHDLKVIVTLFDQYHNYASENYADAHQHLAQLCLGLESHSAILAWDLKNESDLDYPIYGKETVQNWLISMQKKLRSLVHQPITASYARAQAMDSETQNLDYLTFHYYEREEWFTETVNQLKTRFPGKDIVLGEFGYHTWQNRPGDAHPEAHQFNYYNAILAHVTKTELSGFLVWTLYDFPLSIQDVSFLAEESYNHHMGIINLNGEEKPALKALKQAMHVVDASGTSITPFSQNFEVVFQVTEDTHLTFELTTQSTTKKLWSGQLSPGSHTVTLKLNETQKNDLLALKSSLHSESQTREGHTSTDSFILRQD